jgi:hypothetical protein
MVGLLYKKGDNANAIKILTRCTDTTALPYEDRAGYWNVSILTGGFLDNNVGQVATIE